MATSEAVALWRGLPVEHFGGDLAVSLAAAAVDLAAVGRLEEGAEAVSEAVTRLRAFVAAGGGDEAELTRSLDVQRDVLAALERRNHAGDTGDRATGRQPPE
ncbi:MAG: hypothetical protein H6744_21885 [Deltaproteobacteria bacterium]|nr:hypothetical protein [Deltaproteobacteria bacterium]